jgi:hypothetical protein
MAPFDSLEMENKHDIGLKTIFPEKIEVSGVSGDLSMSFAICRVWNLILALDSLHRRNIFRLNETFVLTLVIE